MKISDLIEKLEEAKAEYGDIKVMALNNGYYAGYLLEEIGEFTKTVDEGKDVLIIVDISDHP
nr:MAG TPA: PTS system mannose-specific transporter subunit, mannose transporter, transferase.8A [Caudoviricetes sp.]